MTSRERVERDLRIVQARLRGIGEEETASLTGVSARHVRRVLAAHRESQPALTGLDAEAVVRDVLDNYEAAIEELAILAEETTHDSTQLGAIKTRLEASRARLDLLQLVGVVPKDLGRVGFDADARGVAKAIVAVLEEEGVSEGVQERIVSAIERPVPA